MKEEWKDKLQDSLAGFEESVPDGLWNEIGEKLSVSADGVGDDMANGKKSHVVLLRTLLAAACVACGLGVFFRLSDDGAQPTVANVGSAKNGSPDTSVSSSEKLIARTDDAYLSPTAKPHVGNSMKSVAGVEEEVSPVEDSGEALLATASPELLENKSEEKEQVVAYKEKNMPTRAKSSANESKGSTRSDFNLMAELPEKKSQKAADKFSATLYAANSMGKDNGSTGMQMLASGSSDVMLSSSPTLGGEHVKGYYVGNSVDESVKHHTPIKAGLSVRYALTNRLGIETGIVYSYLSSDISQGEADNNSKTEQNLHFVGVPISVDYTVWNSRWVRVYVSAGGMVEKNVKGKSTATYVLNGKPQSSAEYDIRMKELQWSVNAAAGVQLNFTQNVGLYAEPGVGYYFDNGSALKTYYSEKPTNFNIKVGLRYSFR